MLKTTLSVIDLQQYLKKQLDHFFPDNLPIGGLEDIVQLALKKLEFSFEHIALSHYRNNGKVYFNHLNSDHYVVFLYYCSHLAYKKNDTPLASKLFYLNKSLNSFHCMYDTELPDVFIVSHGIGTVLGKAKYSNYFVVTQGCTVGANAKIEYPKFDEYVVMYPNSSILGNSKISNRVICSNNSMVLNQYIDSNSIIAGRYPNIELKKISTDVFSQFFIKE